eukprot:6966533-Pyramimonas_sp.AAC.1
MEFIGFPLELKLRLDSTAARGIISRTGCGALKHIETRLLWLQAKYDEEKLKVHKEPTATNTADGCTKPLQATKFAEWRARLGMGFDNGDELETSKREAISGDSGQWGRQKQRTKSVVGGSDDAQHDEGGYPDSSDGQLRGGESDDGDTMHGITDELGHAAHDHHDQSSGWL